MKQFRKWIALAVAFGAPLTLAACNTAPVPNTSPDAMVMSLEEAPDETAEFSIATQTDAGTNALVRAIHLSPDAPAVDVFVDDALLTQGLSYTNFVGPAPVPFGTRNLKVKAANTTTTVIDANLELEAKRRYSVYAAGKLAQIAPLVLEDTRYKARNAAKLRVLHGAASAPRVDVYLSRPTTDLGKIDPILENIPFKSISSYFRLRPGGLRVRVTLPDTKTVVIDSGALEIKAGDVLTAVAIDKPNEAGKFSAILIDETKFNAPTTAPAPKSIVEIAAGNPAFSTLVSALGKAGLVDALKAAGPFTVFAPTNDAFAKLASLPDGDALKQVLLYHVASGKFLAADLLKAGEVTTLQGKKITIKQVGNDVILNGVVKVTTADIPASNGVIHVIDTVLIPPTDPSIVEIAAGNPAFSTLVSALQKAGLVNALKGAGPFTVFAPTNDAFAKLASVPDGDALKQVLLYHVANGKFLADDLIKAGEVTTLQGKKIKVEKKSNGDVILNGVVKVTTANIMASNGVVHVIDTVLIPPTDPTIVDIAAADLRFTTLVGALRSQNLVGVLSGPGPFTVFAPTNDAFAKLASLPSGDALTRVLKYHVLSGKFSAADLSKLKEVQTLAGEGIFITKQGNSLILNGLVKVIIADIQASNGVIHVIDTVLLPDANVRAIHASFDAPAVDVLVNGKPAFENISFGTATPYATVPYGTQQVKINVAGTNTTALQATLWFSRNMDFTVIALNQVAHIEALVLNDSADGNAKPGAGKSKLRLVHGASQAGTVDVYITAPNDSITNIDPTISNFMFKANTKYLEVNSGDYRVRITAPHSKTAVIDTGKVTLPSTGVFTGVALDPKPGTSTFGALLVQDR